MFQLLPILLDVSEQDEHFNLEHFLLRSVGDKLTHTEP